MDREQTRNAEETLGMTDEDRAQLRVLVAVDLLLAKAGIPEDVVTTAYRQRLAEEVRSAANALLNIVS